MMAHGKAVGVLRMKVAQSENSPVPDRGLSRFTVLGGVGWGKKWVRVRVRRIPMIDRLKILLTGSKGFLFFSLPVPLFWKQ